MTPTELQDRAEAWYAKQIETLKLCHGTDWPKYRAWVEGFLKEEIRQRLIALGWRPKS